MKKRSNPPPPTAKKPAPPPNPPPIVEKAEHPIQWPDETTAPPSEPVAQPDQQHTIDYLRHRLSLLQQELEADQAKLREEIQHNVDLRTRLHLYIKTVQQIGQAEGQVIGAKVQAIQRALDLPK